MLLNISAMPFNARSLRSAISLVVITQEEAYTEKLFLHPTFVRAKWIKQDLKTVDLIISGKDQILRFHNIPRTTVKFDPYRIATWKLSKTTRRTIEDRDIKIALEYAEGKSSYQLKDKYGTDAKGITRSIRKGIQNLARLAFSQKVANSGIVAKSDEEDN